MNAVHNSEEIEVWEEDMEGDNDADGFSHSASTSTSTSNSTHSLVHWLAYCIALLQKRHCVPNAAIASLLLFLSVFWGVLSKIAPQVSGIVANFPRTLR